MKNTMSYTKYTLALVMGAAVCCVSFALFANQAHAEESDHVPEVGVDLPDETGGAPATEGIVGELKKQIEALRAQIKEQHSANTSTHLELKAKHASEKTDRLAENKEIRKAERLQSREEFMATIADLPEAEQKVAIKAYIADAKAAIALKRSEFEAKKDMRITERKVEQDAKKAQREQSRSAFRDSIKDLGGSEKRAAILEYLAEVQKQVLEKQAQLTDKLTGSEAVVE